MDNRRGPLEAGCTGPLATAGLMRIAIPADIYRRLNDFTTRLSTTDTPPKKGSHATSQTHKDLTLIMAIKC